MRPIDSHRFNMIKYSAFRCSLAFLIFHYVKNATATDNVCVATIETSSIIIDFGSVLSRSIRITPRHSPSFEETLKNNGSRVTLSNFEPDTLYDIRAVAEEGGSISSCTAHTDPAPIKVIVGEQPLPDAAFLFVGSNPRITRWEMELELQNRTSIRKWNTTAGKFYGFTVDDLTPNTNYRVRARASEIRNQFVDRTDFGEWTSFTTGKLSVFGRVTPVNTVSMLESFIQNASNVSTVSILSQPVHYEIEVEEHSLPVSTNFTLTSSDFRDSIINNGETARGSFYWFAGDKTDIYDEISYSPSDTTIECTLERKLEGGVAYTTENGTRNLVPLESLRNPDEMANPCLGRFLLQQNDAPSDRRAISNGMEYNTVYGIGIVLYKEVLLRVSSDELLYTKVYEGKMNDASNDTRKQTFFYKNIHINNLRLPELSYNCSDSGESSTITVKKVPKSVKYEIRNSSQTVAELTSTDIDGSESLQMQVNNLVPNTTTNLILRVTALSRDGNEVTAEGSFTVKTCEITTPTIETATPTTETATPATETSTPTTETATPTIETTTPTTETATPATETSTPTTETATPTRETATPATDTSTPTTETATPATDTSTPTTETTTSTTETSSPTTETATPTTETNTATTETTTSTTEDPAIEGTTVSPCVLEFNHDVTFEPRRLSYPGSNLSLVWNNVSAEYIVKVESVENNNDTIYYYSTLSPEITIPGLTTSHRYHVCVIASFCNSSQVQNKTECNTFTTNPSSVSGVKFSSGLTSVLVTWDSVRGAETYSVKILLQANILPRAILTEQEKFGITGTSAVFNNLSPCRTYSAGVTAVNSGGKSIPTELLFGTSCNPSTTTSPVTTTQIPSTTSTARSSASTTSTEDITPATTSATSSSTAEESRPTTSSPTASSAIVSSSASTSHIELDTTTTQSVDTTSSTPETIATTIGTTSTDKSTTLETVTPSKGPDSSTTGSVTGLSTVITGTSPTAAPESTGTPWWLIFAIVAAIVIIILCAVAIIQHQRSKKLAKSRSEV